MKISKVETKLFQYTSYVESDDEGHGHPAKALGRFHNAW